MISEGELNVRVSAYAEEDAVRKSGGHGWWAVGGARERWLEAPIPASHAMTESGNK